MHRLWHCCCCLAYLFRLCDRLYGRSVEKSKVEGVDGQNVMVQEAARVDYQLTLFFMAMLATVCLKQDMRDIPLFIKPESSLAAVV